MTLLLGFYNNYGHKHYSALRKTPTCSRKHAGYNIMKVDGEIMLDIDHNKKADLCKTTVCIQQPTLWICILHVNTCTL